jgi:hypothetical protein
MVLMGGLAAGGRLALCGAQWRKVSTCWSTKVPPHEHLIKEAPSVIDPDSSKLQPYLLGAWQEGWVDPNTTWAIGPLPEVSHFVVKAAARRVLLMGLRSGDPEFSVIHGHRPRLIQASAVICWWLKH